MNTNAKELTSLQKIIIEKHIKNFKEFTKKNEEIKEAKKPQIIEPKKLSRILVPNLNKLKNN